MTGERVEDTRTLQPGDRVTAHVIGRVTKVAEHGVFVEPDDGGAAFLPHGATTADRHAKPLPPEPPVGAEVLDRDGVLWVREDDESASPLLRWHTLPDDHTWGTWEALLRQNGPVRLLGDPIEAP